ncbi:hypothetical protein GCM10023192_41070 [Amycolatopsis samaneae]
MVFFAGWLSPDSSVTPMVMISTTAARRAVFHSQDLGSRARRAGNPDAVTYAFPYEE